MGQGQLVLKQFPWFTFTTFSQNFTDHQFFYHLLLAIPSLFIPPLIATKALAVILATLFFIMFCWFLKQTGIRYRFFYLIILLTTGPFIFRINLAKAGSLALILLFMGIHSLWQKKYTRLFTITFLYVWTHAGWMSMGMVYFVWFVANFITMRLNDSEHAFLRMSTKCIRILMSDRALWAIVLGMFFGVVFNPYFPNNIMFYWQQAIQIGLVNYQSVINVGAEWYPFPISKLAIELMGILIVCASALGAFTLHCLFAKPKKLSHHINMLTTRVLHMTMLSGLWFALTIKSARYVEYLAPSAILAGALLIELLMQMGAWETIKKYTREHYHMYCACACALGIFYLGLSWSEASTLKKPLSGTLPWNRLKESSAYLAANTPKNRLIFHTNWSDAPLLFFHNTHNRYMAGLDPTFFYLANPNLYRRYTDISRGGIHRPAEAIYRAFNTQYMLITLPQDWNLNYQLKKEPRVQALFHDDESIVYRYSP